MRADLAAPIPGEHVAGLVVHHDVEQGSDEWRRLHIGVPSASEFDKVMASGVGGGESKGRASMLRRMAGEILTGEPAESYENAAMRRGKEMEAEACEHYAFTRGVELERVGFVTRELPGARLVGCSPDRLVGKEGVLETKTMRPDLLIELALKGAGGFPAEHRAQCQGILWVADREWVDLKIFYRRFPASPTFRVVRDEEYIKRLSDAVEVFHWDLARLVERIRSIA